MEENGIQTHTDRPTPLCSKDINFKALSERYQVEIQATVRAAL